MSLFDVRPAQSLGWTLYGVAVALGSLFVANSFTTPLADHSTALASLGTLSAALLLASTVVLIPSILYFDDAAIGAEKRKQRAHAVSSRGQHSKRWLVEIYLGCGVATLSLCLCVAASL